MLPRCALPRPAQRHVRLASRITPRRGRNLTGRYCAPERAPLVSQGSASASELWRDPHVSVRMRTPVKTVAGFVVPEEPRVPADDECCMSGCAICVYDLYEEALKSYKDSVATLRAALSALRIPETEWPAHIRTSPVHTSPTHTTMEKSKDAVLSAFEEMERALKEKREKRAVVEAEKIARGDVLGGDEERVGLYEGMRWILFPNR